MKVLITGASGLLGATLLAELRLDFSVVGLYNTHSIQLSNTQCLQADITRFDETKTLLDRLKPDVIINCAAETDIDRCENNLERTKMTNVEVPKFLAQYCKNNNSKLIQISTDAFFDGENLTFSEQSIPKAKSNYAKSKLEAENLILQHNQNSLILRTNIYGWNFQNKLSLAEWFISENQKDKITQGFKDVYFSPILTNTLAKYIIAFINKVDCTGIYHVAGDKGLSKFEFGNLILNKFQLDKTKLVPISINDIPFKGVRSKNMVLNTSKVRALFPNIECTIESDISKFKLLNDSGYVKNLKNQTL